MRNRITVSLKLTIATLSAVACLTVGCATAAHAGNVFGSLVGALTGGVGGGSGGTKSGDGAPNKNDSVEGMQERRYSYLETAEGAGARASTQPGYGYGGSDVRDAKGSAQPGMIMGAQLNGTLYSEVPMTPLATINFPVASKAQENEMYKHCPPLTGYQLTDSADYINTAIANDVLLGKLSDPERWVNVSKATQQAQNTQMGNALAELTRNQANSAIDFCSTYLTNFTTSKQWNAVRDKLFIPIAILLLLPGAMLAQVKAIVAAGTPVIEETQPFEGLLRSIIAIFLIPATCLVLNYGIDLSNSLTYTIKTEYQNIFHDDMYQSAICAEVRAFPVRQEAENRGALDVPTTKMGQLLPEAKTTFAKVEGQLFSTKLEDPCAGLYNAPKDRVDEALPTNVVAARLAFNGINAALTCGWNALCAFQAVYLYYLWLMGPIVAALWVWPMKMFRDALPSWIEGCITLCFWSMLWNTTILLMACFRGYDETGTIMMTAMNTLATLCVKYAFNFVGLVAAAGAQASSIGSEMSNAMKGGAGGAGASGSAGGGASSGRSSSSSHSSASSAHSSGGAAGGHAGPTTRPSTGAELSFAHGGVGGGSLGGTQAGHLSLTSHSASPMGMSSSIHGGSVAAKLSDIIPPPGSLHGSPQAAALHLQDIASAMHSGMSSPPGSHLQDIASAMHSGISMPPGSHLQDIASAIHSGISMPPGSHLQDITNSAMHLGSVLNASSNMHVGGDLNIGGMNIGGVNIGGGLNVGGGTDIFNSSTLAALGGLSSINNAINNANSSIASSVANNIDSATSSVWNTMDGSQIDLGLNVDSDMSQVNLGADIDIAGGAIVANGDYNVDMDQVTANNVSNAATNTANSTMMGDSTDNSSSVMNSSIQNALASDIVNNGGNAFNIAGGVGGDSMSVMNHMANHSSDSTNINNANMATMNSSMNASFGTDVSNSVNSNMSNAVNSMTNFANDIDNNISNAVNNASNSNISTDINSSMNSAVNSVSSSMNSSMNASSGGDVTNSANNISSSVGNMIQSSVAGDIINNGGNSSSMQSSFNASNAADIFNQSNISSSIDASNANSANYSNSMDSSNSMNIATTSMSSYDSSISSSSNNVANVAHDVDVSHNYGAPVNSYDAPTNNYSHSVDASSNYSQQNQSQSQVQYQAPTQSQTTQSQQQYYTDNTAANVGSQMQAQIANSLSSDVVQGVQHESQQTYDVDYANSNTDYSNSNVDYSNSNVDYSNSNSSVDYSNSNVAYSNSNVDSSSSQPAPQQVSQTYTQYSSDSSSSSSSNSTPSSTAYSEYARYAMSDASSMGSSSNSIPGGPPMSNSPMHTPDIAIMPVPNFVAKTPAPLNDVVKQSLTQPNKDGKESSAKSQQLASQSAKAQSKLSSALRGAGCPLPPGGDKKTIAMPPSSKANSMGSPMDISAGSTKNRYKGTAKMTEEELRQLEESTGTWWT